MTTGDPLTRQEKRVAKLVAAGLRNKEIAAALMISLATANKHITSIYEKTGVHQRILLARWVDSHPEELKEEEYGKPVERVGDSDGNL